MELELIAHAITSHLHFGKNIRNRKVIEEKKKKEKHNKNKSSKNKVKLHGKRNVKR